MCSLILYFFFVFSISSHSWAFLQCSSVTFEDGKKYQLLDSRGQVKFVTEEENCEVLLNVLLVGGGGDGDIFEGHAGGSGFVDFKQVSVDPSIRLDVDIGRAGNFGESGDATTIEQGGRLLFGVPGGVGGEDAGGNGGNGYSGGGGGGANGFPGGDGGFDGGDGEHSPFSSEGGLGSGLNISSISLQYFKLRPGAGGIGQGFYGGGGGGVVVEVDGKVINHARREDNDGEGFGAGAGTHSSNGVALLEILDTMEENKKSF